MDTYDKQLQLLIRHPTFTLKYISLTYPFTIEELRAYKYILDWYYIHQNHSIQWSISLIEEFKEFIFYYNPKTTFEPILIHTNHSIPWSEELLLTFKENWQWSLFAENDHIISNPTLKKLVDKYSVIYPEPDVINDLSRILDLSIAQVPSGSDHVLDYKISVIKVLEYLLNTDGKIPDKKCFEKASCSDKIPWSYNIIKQYQDYWDWNNISSNWAIPWTTNLIMEFSDKIFLGGFSQTPQGEIMDGLINNRSVNWNAEITDYFKEVIDWSFFTERGNWPNTLEFLECFESEFKWDLMRNEIWENVFWEFNSFENHKLLLDIINIQKACNLRLDT